MMKTIFALLSLMLISLMLISSVSMAAGQIHAAETASCLKTVNDQDLLDEVAFRMGRATPNPAANALASFSCRFQTLTISLVDASTGNEQREEMNLTDQSMCSQLESTLSNKIGNRALTKPSIVAGCRFQTLLRVSLNPNGQLKKLQDQSMTDTTACNSARDRINDAL